MIYKVLILGASYGSLLGTKLALAGHHATLVCRAATAELINRDGTEVSIPSKTRSQPFVIRSKDLPGTVRAETPATADPRQFDLVVLAMSEPQYADPAIAGLMSKIKTAQKPCLSLMNMPPLAYLARIPGLDTEPLKCAYATPDVWDGFDSDLMSLCSPDPQAFRPPDRSANVLTVGLPTNFRAAEFGRPECTNFLTDLSADIDAVRIDGEEVPVKLRLHQSLFVPLAKWSMLLAGNYRCIQAGAPRSIRDAVHTDLDATRSIYESVNKIIEELGADPASLVPFEKYAKAAEGLIKPSSAARAIASGATSIERVDILVAALAEATGQANPAITEIVDMVDTQLSSNLRKVA